ncbi:MAG: YfgM family protein [Gammaproteobacteria bacterium]
MEGYGTDSEQIEALRNWWTKNGRYVVAGLVIAALVIGGWRLWNYWQARRAGAAAALYAPVVIAEQKNDSGAVVKAARAVISQYPDTAYGALSGLALAKAQFIQHRYAKAEQALDQVARHSPDKGFATIARLRLARIQLQRGDAKSALATLGKENIAPAFTASADTLRGEAFLALGRNGEARKAWQAALAASDPTGNRHQLLEMQLASLPPAPASGSTPSAAAARGASTKAPGVGTKRKGEMQ